MARHRLDLTHLGACHPALSPCFLNTVLSGAAWDFDHGQIPQQTRQEGMLLSL